MASHEAVREALAARPTAGVDQQAMVRDLSRGGQGEALVVGRDGPASAGPVVPPTRSGGICGQPNGPPGLGPYPGESPCSSASLSVGRSLATCWSPRLGLVVGMLAAMVAGWGLRYRPSPDAVAWRRGRLRLDSFGQLWHRGYPLAPALRVVDFEADRAAQVLPDPDVAVVPIVAVHRAQVPRARWSWTVCR
jgi:hypothetical protein